MANVPDVILNSGHRMPLVGFGTVTYPMAASDSIKSEIINGIKAGYRHFDTASLYQTDDAHQDRVLPALKNSLR
ncbi:hypothetical protein IFM89_000780 [Coptis chinensis]|uniref:NADP-dependent oxidoreductase domain-containing protein n=1 Tax=Coptis chinensis TaxID=261450 RepID=A0A835MGW3_9MAGN|nr:hypothetical protein IFM89_000780 [Coptis chinensis]